jgi:DeoR family transcriptional regulator, myo-inositol catabolism operon repressor
MKINRINNIQEMLENETSLSINDLCDHFDVSKNTIRRDIAELEKRGIIEKVYGGITLKQSALAAPEPFASREMKNSLQKQKIARIAATLVNDGDVIYIDSGTTTMHMVPFLANRKHLTIVTASVYVINAATAYPNFNVIATGGSLYLPSKAFVGTSVLRCLQNYNLSKIFLASTGISLESGATNVSPLESEIKRCLVQKTSQKFLLVDASKIDVASLMTYCQLSELDSVIMDKLPPQKYRDYFTENNVQLLTENPEPTPRTKK